MIRVRLREACRSESAMSTVSTHREHGLTPSTKEISSVDTSSDLSPEVDVADQRGRSSEPRRPLRLGRWAARQGGAVGAGAAGLCRSRGRALVTGELDLAGVRAALDGARLDDAGHGLVGDALAEADPGVLPDEDDRHPLGVDLVGLGHLAEEGAVVLGVPDLVLLDLHARVLLGQVLEERGGLGADRAALAVEVVDRPSASPRAEPPTRGTPRAPSAAGRDRPRDGEEARGAVPAEAVDGSGQPSRRHALLLSRRRSPRAPRRYSGATGVVPAFGAGCDGNLNQVEQTFE